MDTQIVDTQAFMADYSRGMEMLRIGAPAFALMASSIGVPQPNPKIPTAQVSFDATDKRVLFEMNPTFISGLSDSEMAAVIAHEAYHVILDHLSEVADVEKFPKQHALIDAQECIINDGLPGNVGFTTPAGTFKGLERHNQDFSIFSTLEGYEFIVNKEKAEAEAEEASDNAESGEQGDESGEAGEGNSNQAGEQDANEGNNSDEAQAGDAHGCSGVKIVGAEGMTLDEVQQAITEAVAAAAQEGLDAASKEAVDLPADLEDFIDALEAKGETLNKTPNFGANVPHSDAGDFLGDKLSGVTMNWAKLLKQINPKLKDAGRPKYKESWHQPRRRMITVYPKVILPTNIRENEGNGKKGDAIPTFIIALDMSYSIPEHLLNDLASLAASVPEKYIKALPITWADDYKVFDPERPREIVRRGGTNINAVNAYAERVKRETGKDPYVLVITDGGYRMPNLSKELIRKNWWWMAIKDTDESRIISKTQDYTTKERVFKLSDFS